jgi:hypothetical protein
MSAGGRHGDAMNRRPVSGRLGPGEQVAKPTLPRRRTRAPPQQQSERPVRRLQLKFSVGIVVCLGLVAAAVGVAYPSTVDVTSVVDVTPPTTSVTLTPGSTGNITINLSVSGSQGATATFKVNRNWTLSGGVYTGSNPQTFTVPARSGSDPATTFATSGTVSIAAGQAAGSFPLTVSAFDITNGSGGGGKLTDGLDATYAVTVASLDTTPPVLTPQVTGTAGANGWYTSNVTVTWTATDAQSSVVVDSGCSTQTFTADTAGTTSSCVAHSAGGSASASVPLKIDHSGPSASLSRSGTTGTNGWFTSNVTVHASGSDAISGPVTCTPDQVVSTETTGIALNGSCTNAAGLTTAAAPITVKLDKTGPSATVTPAGTTGTNGWFTSDVAVSTSGSDGISGPVTCSAPQTLSTETTGTAVIGSCTNDAGLMTAANPVSVKIDKTNPTAALSVDGTHGSNGWYVSAVVVSTIGADTVSAPVTCSADQAVSSDTTGTTVNGSCTNAAGLNQAAAPVTVKLDTTPPTNVGLAILSGTPGAHGWYTGDVVVRTSGEDPTSGVTCTADQTVTAQGTTQVTGQCTNGAGLTTQAQPLTLRIDRTGPAAALTVTAGTLGFDGWYTSAVTVATVGSDDVSGPVTCTADQQVTDDAASVTLTGSCTNDAGLTTTAAPLTLAIDASAPTAVALAVVAGTPGTNDWYTSDVVVRTNGEDATSGLICTTDQTVTAQDTTQVTGSCTNGAGLSTDAHPLTIRIDHTAPAAALTVTDGTVGAGEWYTSDVTVQTNGSDDISGPVTCTAVQVLSTETAGTVVSGSCTNAAGLSTDADPLTVKLDKTGPSAAITPSGTLGANGWYTGDVTASTAGSDDISGPVSCTATQVLSTETTGTTLHDSCTNAAGLATDADAVTVRIDRTSPTASLSVNGTLGVDGWYISPVVVSTSGADTVSTPVSCTSDQTLSDDTTGTDVHGSCTNDAGLHEDADPVTLKIDTTPPTDVALSVVSGTAGAHGWYTSDVVVRTTGADATSGVSCTTDRTVTTQGTTEVTGQCTNGAGLPTDAAPLTLHIDQTAPTASLAVSAGTLGANGWYTSAVTVSTTGGDDVSGPVTCTTDQTVTAEGTSELTGSCTNDAGLTTTAAPLTVDIDTTAPVNVVLTIVSGTPGADGWYTSDVVVRTTGGDPTSGVTCTADQIVGDQGATELTGSCTNGAGLTTDARSITVLVDQTAPSAELAITDGTMGANGWFTSDVTVSTTGGDDVSGPVSCSLDQVVSTETAGLTVSGSCTNGAGLTTQAAALTVKLDKSGPSAVITPSGTGGANSWFTSDVTVQTTGADDISGPVTCTDAQVLSSETAGTTLHGSCTNSAGLTTQADPATVKIDQTNPTATLSVSGTLGTAGWYVSPVVVSTIGADTVSAPVTCTADQPLTADTTGTEVHGSCANDAGLEQDAAPVNVKIDATPPTDVTLSVVSGTAGAHGWYTSDVVVRTTGQDATSGVTCTTDQTVTAQGATVVTGHCTNGAGLTTDAPPLSVRIDHTAPSASLAVVAGTVGANGWYTSAVTVSTTGSDDVSGPAICTADQTLSTDGNNQTVTGSCTNDAGLTTSAAPITLSIDTTAPTSVALSVVTGTPGAHGWYTSDVVVRTTGEDPTSGLSCVADQIVSNQGATSVSGHCSNAAGLTTDAAPLAVRIDHTAPSATLVIIGGTVGTNGWFTSDVTVSMTGSDDVSGPPTCTADQVVASDTTGTVITGSCTNDAGLTTDATPITVKLDETGPSATITPSGTGGANGWYTGDVAVATTGSDDISDPVSCTAIQVLSTETTGTTLHGSCTNDAGLTTDAASVLVKVDKTNPTASLSVNGTLGAAGWYVSPIVVSTIGADTVSAPVSCTADQNFSADTAGTPVNGTCANDAGLSQSADPVTIRIDTTPPTDVALRVVSGTAGAHGWYTSDVVVRTTGADSTSGVTCTTDQTVTAQGTTQVTGQCTNGAGLTTDAAPLTLRIDHTAPSATLTVTAGTLGLNGWYTSDVVVHANGGDDVSGPVTCTADQQLTDESANATVTGSCTNDAGLTTAASPLTLKIDKFGPAAVTFVGATAPGTSPSAAVGGIGNGSTFTWGSVPGRPNCTAVDRPSGLGSCVVNGYSTTVGPHTLTAVATDNAGNVSTARLTYTVLPWRIAGFTQPVSMDTASDRVVNVAKGGSTVPLKFEVFAGATELTSTSAVKALQITRTNCVSNASILDPVDALATGGTVLRHDGSQFIYNWKTPSQPGTCWDVVLLTQDGSAITAHFQLK